MGARRKVLVVDNEEVDRGFLASVLEPLGFEVAQAASGEEALARVAGLAPDAILMDLAMPGIDGWETIRRVRALLPRPPRIAIVSANAFDKGLENDVEIRPEDFLVKPVRLSELLDWLGRQLALQWLDQPPAAEAPPPAPAAPLAYPDAASRAALQQAVDVGFPRGITNALDAIERSGTGKKEDVLKAIFETKDRQSVLGTYSIDENGDTSLTDYGIYSIEDGTLKFDKTIKAAAN